jgi:ankyrin repeat protein
MNAFFKKCLFGVAAIAILIISLDALIAMNAGVDPKGWTELHTACIECDTRKITKELAEQTPPDVEDERGRTPLVELFAGDCSIDNRKACLKLLIKGGANVRHVNKNGTQAIHSRLVLSSAKSIELLFEHGAALDAVDSNGNTALHLLCSEKLHRQRDQQAVRTLLALGAKSNIVNKDKRTPLECAKNAGRTDLVVIFSGVPETGTKLFKE